MNRSTTVWTDERERGTRRLRVVGKTEKETVQEYRRGKEKEVPPNRQGLIGRLTKRHRSGPRATINNYWKHKGSQPRTKPL